MSDWVLYLQEMSFSATGSGLLDVDPARQWDWHEAHRDIARNQYRTSYTDMSHGKETYVKSDYPAGYGGHIPNMRFDILFRNTAFDRNQVLKRNDPGRDAHPSFKDQISGIPTWCSKPQGATKHPSYGVVAHDGSTRPLAPWGVVRPVREPPTHRNVPATLARARSSPMLERSNQAAQSAGASMTRSASQAADTMPAPDGSPTGFDRVKRTVSMANQEARQQQMPSEHEMLMEEMMM